MGEVSTEGTQAVNAPVAPNYESILTSVKKLLGIEDDYTHFDADIIMHINSVFSILLQIGVGPAAGFAIEDSTSTWDEFVTGEPFLMVRSYVYLKVRLLFDPPVSSAAMEAINRQISELEWRLLVAADPPINAGRIANE